ncbi:McrB family protein [Bacteroides xylanisolvens]|uniref:McrB family protein n=1 Tax=Bacteroides xylanisolvens TaxID=371601 RepID=UPI001E36A4C4|nr:AAA family ATPase [Bacteroides xylanisolvens]
MKDLFSFLNEASCNSDFKATLSGRGGFITFSNSGRRGGTKFFQIGLDNILQTLKDILVNLESFKGLTEYDETSWRNNGSAYFSDPVANANSTVQTKPLFSTLSKVIIWANQPMLDSVDSDVKICLEKEALETTIDELENVADSFRPSVIKPHQSCDSTSRQQIFYGAPGTGKSHKIKEQLKGVAKENIFRTTFHPDSDYSTFVGAYKPTKSERPLYGLFGKETVRLRDEVDLSEEIITYKFIPQAFLNAYMQAYRKPNENVYLIIEEINRGNCAQIFGDLFQLLDRDENGVSEYTIKADADLKAYLKEELGEDNLGIKDGELCLPANLYIYATMNTSDQSLFPIDSAFKRRWDWEYEPIKYKNTDWVIDIDGTEYRWSDFQKEVNKHILKDTGSEDKMMGDYFINPPTKVISFNLFRNKILFYLWNDVCKDGDADIFPIDTDFSFSKLYDEDCKQLIISMMDKLGLKPIDRDELENYDDTSEGDDELPSTIRYSINGEETDENGKVWRKGALVKRAVKIYCDNHQQETAAQIRDTWKAANFIIPHIVETDEDREKRIKDSRDPKAAERSKEIRLSNNESLHVSTQVGDGKNRKGFSDFLSIIQSKPEWGINIQEL